MLSEPGNVAVGNALFYGKRKKYKKKLLTLEKFFARMILALLMKTKSAFGLRVLVLSKSERLLGRRTFEMQMPGTAYGHGEVSKWS